ncbi:MAG: 16S rRNA (cytosine(1402)-N(4))-methyltransferase RsmH [Candidatus Omnitrophica bacterium]|nr:16S rRNA (cytosine(1402)-N(4))-methyltransferase RsmH [Candidatus Omnitrophota bacterium]
MCRHIPVMYSEVLSYMKLLPGKVIVDCTLGEGGHSEGILRKITPGGHLIGIDQDDDALSATRLRLSRFEGSFSLIRDNFKNITDVLANLDLNAMDGVVFDLGVSNMQLVTPERGFSFQFDGPLNMRMDKHAQITAFDLVNNLSEEEIANLIFTFGQERYSRRIASRIVRERSSHVITTTQQLADIVVASLPVRERYKRTHPATKTFMALRIAVNRELEVLQSGLTQAIDLLKPGGIICVIAFHSLEDRIVKLEFKSQAKRGRLKIITKKPLIPTDQEIETNRKSRSAKLRVAEKL